MKANSQIAEIEANSIRSTHIYMTAHIPGFGTALTTILPILLAM
jgi:hypothetical protein